MKLRSAVKRALTGKAIVLTGVAVFSMVAIVMIISGIFDTISAPVRALDQSVSALFGHESEAVDTEISQRLDQCVGGNFVDTASSAMQDVPTAANPHLAHAWLLYSLAHSDANLTRPTTSSTATTAPRAGGSRSQSPQSATTFLTFARNWQLITAQPLTSVNESPTATPQPSTGDNDPSWPPIPTALTTLDPATDYQPVTAQAAAALLELGNRSQVALSDSDRLAIAEILRQHCLAETTTSSTATTTEMMTP